MALCFFYFYFYSRNSFSAFELKLLFFVFGIFISEIYFGFYFRFWTLRFSPVDLTAQTSVFCMTVSWMFFFCFVFNLWINIFHLMVWLHASSLHTFLFFPVNLSSLAHCDDVVFVIITIDLSKLLHCRKFLFLFSCYCLQRQVLFCWFQININVIQVIWGVCFTILQPATRVQCGLFWACLQETPSFQLGQILSIGRIYFTLVF